MGDHVWLEASHLKLPYHIPNLAPKQQGPFQVIQEISPVAYPIVLQKTVQMFCTFAMC
jgi:hypothetical protein